MPHFDDTLKNSIKKSTALLPQLKTAFTAVPQARVSELSQQQQTDTNCQGNHVTLNT